MLVIDPDERTATAFRRLAAPVTSPNEIDLDDIVPGFHCTLAEILDRA